MNKLSLLAGSLTLAAVILPAAAFAQTINVDGGVSVSAHPSVTATTRVSTKPGISLTSLISRADTEITSRIADLNSLSTRIGGMVTISANEKATLQAGISNEVSNLTSLKATIDADTSLMSLQTSLQSITKDYRIYMLIVPQGRIAAASDRAQTIIADMQALEPKLEARITTAQTAGVNVTSAQSAYIDMQAKVSDASVQVSAALSETINLTPDQGNTTVEASNTAALKDAASKIKTATADLKAARADVTTIMNAVKGTDSASGSLNTRASVQ